MNSTFFALKLTVVVMSASAILATASGLAYSAQNTKQTDNAFLSTHTASGSIPIQSWKTLRDVRVVKQDLDYSCSAASLATLLNEFYGQSITEEALLKAMDKGNLRALFEDM